MRAVSVGTARSCSGRASGVWLDEPRASDRAKRARRLRPCRSLDARAVVGQRALSAVARCSCATARAAGAAKSGWTPGAAPLCRCADRIRPDDDRVGHERDFVGRHAGALGLLAHLLRAGALVEADRAELARPLLDHVGADPAHVVGHLVADPRGLGGGRLELLGGSPEVAAADRVEVHSVLLVGWLERRDDRTGGGRPPHRAQGPCWRSRLPILGSGLAAQPASPSSRAALAASSRERAPSLSRIADTWWPAVFGEITSSAAISAFVSPAASSSSTST